MNFLQLAVYGVVFLLWLVYMMLKVKKRKKISNADSIFFFFLSCDHYQKFLIVGVVVVNLIDYYHFHLSSNVQATHVLESI